MTKEKFKIALEIFADMDAMHNGSNREEYMEKVVDFLYDAVNDEKQETVITAEIHPSEAYVAMAYAGGDPAWLIGVFTTFDKAKVAVMGELETYMTDSANDRSKFEDIDKAFQALSKMTIEDFIANEGVYASNPSAAADEFSFEITQIPLDEGLPCFDFM